MYTFTGKWLINIKVHFHLKMKRMRDDCLSLSGINTIPPADPFAALPSYTYSLHASTFTMEESDLFKKTRETVSGLLKFTLSNRG